MKILGIDYGDARTGLSVSDPTGLLAGSPSVIAEWNRDKLLDKLTAYITENKIETIVLGYPKNMDGTVRVRKNAPNSPPTLKPALGFRSSCGMNAAPRSKHTKSCTKQVKKPSSTAKMSMLSPRP